MEYTHHFQIKASLSRVSAFHLHPASMGAITPPPIRVQLSDVPADMSNGGEMDFTLWLGPLPIHWVARFEDVSENGFTDRQLSGPFAQWVHRHSFGRIDDDTTDVIDEISIRLRVHPFWMLVGLGFVSGLPVLFAYRAWKTRRLIEEGSRNAV